MNARADFLKKHIIKYDDNMSLNLNSNYKIKYALISDIRRLNTLKR